MRRLRIVTPTSNHSIPFRTGFGRRTRLAVVVRMACPGTHLLALRAPPGRTAEGGYADPSTGVYVIDPYYGSRKRRSSDPSERGVRSDYKHQSCVPEAKMSPTVAWYVAENAPRGTNANRDPVSVGLLYQYLLSE